MTLRLILFCHRNKLVLILFKETVTEHSPWFSNVSVFHAKPVDHMLSNFKVGGWRLVKKEVYQVLSFLLSFPKKKKTDRRYGSNQWIKRYTFTECRKSTSRLQTRYIYIVSKSLAGGFFLGNKWCQSVRDTHQSMKGRSRALNAFGD